MFIPTAVVLGIAYASLYFFDQWGIMLLLVAYGFFLMMAFIQFTERGNLFSSIVRMIRLCGEAAGQVVALHLILLMLSFSFLIILSAPLLYMNTSILQWNFAETDVWPKNIFSFIDVFLKLLAITANKRKRYLMAVLPLLFWCQSC